MAPAPPYRPRVIAHRAKGFFESENTAGAFERAADAEIDGVELDVRITRDGVPVVIHDPHTVDDDVVAGTDRPDLHAKIPSLETALEILLPQLPVDVEIKSIAADLNPIAALVDRPGIRISSFDWQILANFQRMLPHIPRALLILQGRPWDEAFRIGGDLGVDGIHLAVKQLSEELVERAHAAQLAVRVYTPNRQEDWQRCVELGVDALMTDRPYHLAAWLKRQGLR